MFNFNDFSSDTHSYSNSWGTFDAFFCPEAKDASMRYWQDAIDARLAVMANQELLEEAEEDLSSAIHGVAAAKDAYETALGAQKAAEQTKAEAWAAYCAGPVGLVVQSERTSTGERNTLYAAYLKAKYEAGEALYSTKEEASEAYKQACLAAKASYRATCTAWECHQACVSEVVNAENRLATAKYEAKRLEKHAEFFSQMVDSTAVNIYWEEGEDGVPVMRVYGGDYLILEKVQVAAIEKPQALLEAAAIDVEAVEVLPMLPPAGGISGQYAASHTALKEAVVAGKVMANTLLATIAAARTNRAAALEAAIASSRVSTASILETALTSSRAAALEAVIASSRVSTASILETALTSSRAAVAAILAKYSI